MIKNYVYEIKTLEEAKGFVTEIGMEDEDFNGNNGPDYLWEEAKGFECNLDYVLDQIKDCKSVTEYVVMFLEFLTKDHYYEDYLVTEAIGNPQIISVVIRTAD